MRPLMNALPNQPSERLKLHVALTFVAVGADDPEIVQPIRSALGKRYKMIDRQLAAPIGAPETVSASPAMLPRRTPQRRWSGERSSWNALDVEDIDAGAVGSAVAQRLVGSVR